MDNREMLIHNAFVVIYGKSGMGTEQAENIAREVINSIEPLLKSREKAVAEEILDQLIKIDEHEEITAARLLTKYVVGLKAKYSIK